MKRLAFLLFTAVMLTPMIRAQENLDYQKPSKEILELVDVPLAPRVMLWEQDQWLEKYVK